MWLTIIFSAVLMNSPAGGAGDKITFWTTEDEKDRLKIQREMLKMPRMRQKKQNVQ